MEIIVTGSLGNIGRSLTQTLLKNGHSVTVISSSSSRAKEIAELGAKAAIGKMQDADFLAKTFKGADIVYLMETMEAVGNMFDKSIDFIAEIARIGECYKSAVERSGVKRVIHLSSVGADSDKGTGILLFHHKVEQILRQLPEDVSIKFIRPVGFFINMLSFIPTIKSKGMIISNYGGDEKEPWVSPKDVAAVIAEEVDSSFHGRTVRYVASDEVSPNEIAKAIGSAIGKPGMIWKVIPNDQLLGNWLGIGFNEQIAKGFIEVQESQGNGSMYGDYNQHKPVMGQVKLADFVKDFVEAFHAEDK